MHWQGLGAPQGEGQTLAQWSSGLGAAGVGQGGGGMGPELGCGWVGGTSSHFARPISSNLDFGLNKDLLM